MPRSLLMWCENRACVERCCAGRF